MNKKLKEVALHDKDTGSSEIQIALLTEKIETLSKHISQFKKDKSISKESSNDNDVFYGVVLAEQFFLAHF